MDAQARRQAVSRQLAEAAGPLREGPALEKAEKTLRQELNEACKLRGADSEEVFLRLRLENDLITALMVCAAARAREETRGCHAREDFPEANKELLRVTLRKGGEGIVVAKETILG